MFLLQTDQLYYTIVTSKLFWPFTLLMVSYTTTTKNDFIRKCNIPLKYDYRTIMKTRLITNMWKGSHNNLPTKLYSLTDHKLTHPGILKQDSAPLEVRQKGTFQQPKMCYKIFNRCSKMLSQDWAQTSILDHPFIFSTLNFTDKATGYKQTTLGCANSNEQPLEMFTKA